MMLNKLRTCLSKEKKDLKIFDIVVYGSAVKGSANYSDIDIVVIFKEGSLKERLSKIQIIKRNIKTDKKIDIKSILIDELFSKEFFAKSSIFLEGISMFENVPFSKRIDFESVALFTYHLKNKTRSEKVKFNYLLAGRNTIGLIEHFKGTHIAPGIVEIPIKHSLEFEDILKKNKIEYRKNLVMKKL